MRQALWGAVALAGWLAVVAIALCVTTPAGERDVAVVDAVVAIIAGVGAVVGGVLLSQRRPAETETEPKSLGTSRTAGPAGSMREDATSS